MPIAFYRCEKCGRDYPTEEAATECEDRHLVPISTVALRYTVKPYPYQIEVTFDNGETQVYNAQNLEA